MKYAIALVLLFVVGCTAGDFLSDAGVETVNRSYAPEADLAPIAGGARTDTGCAIQIGEPSYCCSRDGNLVCCLYTNGVFVCRQVGGGGGNPTSPF